MKAVVAAALLITAPAAPAVAQAPSQAPAATLSPAPTSPFEAWMTDPRDWSATLVQDATALHDIVIDSHPGIYDAQNPGFRARVDEGLAIALERAKTTTTPGGWWWALRAYVASFDDGHLQIGAKTQTGFPTRWPGFLTVHRAGSQVVAERDQADASTPPLGATLIDCDGVPADRLAEQRIGAFRGRWFLESQHVLLGDWLFMNASNPWAPEMRQCRFQSDGQTRAYALTWRTIEPADIGERRDRIGRRARPDFGLRTLDDGAFWLSMPSFDGDPAGDAHQALTALLTEAEAKQAELRAAPYVVLDLRGNGGGSSHWSENLAVTLWGADWIRAHNTPPIEAIEWRASEANLAAIQSYLDEWTAAGESAQRINWAREIVEGMTEARAAGEPYWRDAAAPRPPLEGPIPTQLVRGPVYVLTDPGCASACLDAVDTWKAAGAIQIGRETSADTVYMDVRGLDLPSGLATMALPMKVWRGRARGNNEPQRPAHVYDGNLADDAALAAWVRALNPAA